MTNKMILPGTALTILLSVMPLEDAAAGPDPFIGEIIWGGWNFCPRGFAAANGQLLSVAENTALFSLLGVQFGGDGRTTFGLPDLRGRVSIHTGQGSGLSNYKVGMKGGEETVTLTATQVPAHNHTINASTGGTDKSPSGNIPGTGKQKNYDAPAAASTALADAAVADAGAGAAHENRQPYLALTACIALQGIYPSRN